MKRRAFITGITGQDGSYLSELLLEKDYEVYGLVRRTSTGNLQRLRPFLNRLRLIPGDMTDQGSLERALKLSAPDEVYNLAAQTFVHYSFEAPLHTADVTGMGALRLFEAIRQTCPHVKCYQASSSEQFGNGESFRGVTPHFQNEQTPFRPISPYGIAKTFAHQCANVYRNSYQLFISCGINFNHESERRGEEFVTRKVTKAIGAIQAGTQHVLPLGNLSAQRDWSHAEDIVQAAWLMLQQDIPADFVIASGVTHSVQEFADQAFACAGFNSSNYIVQDESLFRAQDIKVLRGDASLAHQVLHWKPSISFKQLIQRMVENDCSSTLHCNSDKKS